MVDEERARAAFREHVRAREAAFELDGEDAAESDRVAGEMRALVASWCDQARDVLLPLLTEEPIVRGNAASFLLRKGAEREAVAVLEELNSDDVYGRAALDADTVLMIWEKENAQ